MTNDNSPLALPNVNVILSNGNNENFDVPPEHIFVSWHEDRGGLTVQAFKLQEDGSSTDGIVLAEFSPNSWLGIRRY